MTLESLVDTYVTLVEEGLDTPPAFINEDSHHILWMLESIRHYGDATHPDYDGAKYNRWLGFVQGYLWMTGLRSIEDMWADVASLK